MTVNTQQPVKAKMKLSRYNVMGDHCKASEEVGYYALAAAIVRQAVCDYTIAKKILAEKGTEKSKTWETRHGVFASHVIDEVQKFFRSQWFGTLCDIDPERIIKKLEARA